MPSNLELAFFAVFLIGIALFIAGTIVVRSAAPHALVEETPVQPPAITWALDFSEGETPLDQTQRRDLIERLALIAQPWCIDYLERALGEEHGEMLALTREALNGARRSA